MKILDHAIACLVALSQLDGPAVAADANLLVAASGTRPVVADLDADADFGPEAATLLWDDVFEACELVTETTRDGRLLVAAPSKRDLKDAMDVVEEALEHFDVGTPPVEGAEDGSRRTAVLIQLEEQQHLATVLARVGELAPYLADWADSMTAFSGFTLGEPLVAAFVDGGVHQEEWNSENEIAHRVGELLTLGRFGQLPYWIAQGLAWRIEYEVCDSVYCFPYRNGFVSVDQHRHWGRQLASLFKKRRRDSDAVRIDELALLRRGTYEHRGALQAWGALTVLTDEDPESTSRWLLELVEIRDRDGKRHFLDGRWEWIPEYEVPTATQLDVLREHFGADVLVHMTAAFRKKVRR